MKELALNNIGVQTMSSLDIAKVVESKHAAVRISIERLMDKEIIQRSSLTTFNNINNVAVDGYAVSKRDSYVVVAQLSPEFTGRLVDRWQELEAKAITLPDFTNPAIAARAWADEVEAKQIALAKIESDKPKVDFAMAVRRLDGSCSVGDFAKVIGYGQNRLFKMLRDDGFLMANNRPYQSAIDRDLLVSVEQTPYCDRDGKSHPAFKTLVTGKGQVYFEKRFRKGTKNGLVSIPKLKLVG